MTIECLSYWRWIELGLFIIGVITVAYNQYNIQKIRTQMYSRQRELEIMQKELDELTKALPQ